MNYIPRFRNDRHAQRKKWNIFSCCWIWSMDSDALMVARVNVNPLASDWREKSGWTLLLISATAVQR